MDDVSRMCSRRQSSLRKQVEKKQRPVQPVMPEPIRSHSAHVIGTPALPQSPENNPEIVRPYFAMNTLLICLLIYIRFFISNLHLPIFINFYQYICSIKVATENFKAQKAIFYEVTSIYCLQQ